jgi:hypothetical protein
MMRVSGCWRIHARWSFARQNFGQRLSFKGRQWRAIHAPQLLVAASSNMALVIMPTGKSSGLSISGLKHARFGKQCSGDHRRCVADGILTWW